MTEDLPYRRCVGAVLFNDGGRVLVCRRRDVATESWQLPQGGIDAGEEPEDAVKRELAEEIGTDKAEIIGECPDWLSYDLPRGAVGRALGGRYRGQRQKWFALRFTGADDDIDLAKSAHPEFSDWKWVPIEDLPSLIVPFKRPVYESIVRHFRRFARPHPR